MPVLELNSTYQVGVKIGLTIPRAGRLRQMFVKTYPLFTLGITTHNCNNYIALKLFDCERITIGGYHE